MEKKCGHEKVCEQCVREEIAVLRKKISELESKLPPSYPTLGGQQWQVHTLPTYFTTYTYPLFAPLSHRKQVYTTSSR
jgi:hypothetical protein